MILKDFIFKIVMAIVRHLTLYLLWEYYLLFLDFIEYSYLRFHRYEAGLYLLICIQLLYCLALILFLNIKNIQKITKY